MKFKNIITGFVLLVTLGSCSNLNEMNIDPSRSSSLDPNYQLTQIQARTWGDWILTDPYINFLSSMSQIMTGDWAASNYGGQFRVNAFEMDKLWNQLYGGLIKEAVDGEYRSRNVETQTNVNAALRVYKVYLFSIITDIFGDVPYFEAGKGYIDGVKYPKYDSQKEIYADFFKELAEATAQFDATKPQMTGDLIYNGDVTQWKHFANSLRLRLAMHLIKIDPQEAAKQAQAAIDGGLMASVSDDAVIDHYKDISSRDAADYTRNAYAQDLSGWAPQPSAFICASFFNKLYTDNIRGVLPSDAKDASGNFIDPDNGPADPRTFVYTRFYDTNLRSSDNNYAARPDITDMIIAHRAYFPILPGHFAWDPWTNKGFSGDYGHGNFYIGLGTVPQISNYFMNKAAPGVILTYAESEFLLAEFYKRIKNSDTDAKSHYDAGYRAAIKHLIQKFKVPASDLPDNKVEQYLIDYGYKPATGLQQICEQQWLLHIVNPVEAFNVFRRTGFPKLKSPSDPTQLSPVITVDAQIIPRRLCYPILESTDNPVEYKKALDNLGGTNDWTKPVWWDLNGNNAN